MKARKKHQSNAAQKAIDNIPKMSRLFLSLCYVRRSDLSLPDLILAALNKIPECKKIDKIDDLEALEAVSWLIDQVPNDDPLFREIESKFLLAAARRDNHKRHVSR